MTNNELLLEISNMMDVKIGTLHQTMRDEMKEMENSLHGEITGLKSELQSEMAGMQHEMAGMKADICALKMQNENDIIPRLQNIESCYVDTSKRFYMELGQMEDLKQDVDVLKKVVAEHSERLQKIS